MAIPVRPLGFVKEMVESIGDEVSYAYDDLIFISHNNYLLQFGESGDQLFYRQNTESSEDELGDSFVRLQQLAAAGGIVLSKQPAYTLIEQEDQQLALHFADA